MTAQEGLTPEQMAQSMSLERLTAVLNRAAEGLPEAKMGDPLWRVHTVVSREVYSRLASHYGAVCDEELAAVLLHSAAKDSQERTGLEDVVALLAEDEMRSRFPKASEYSDDALMEMDIDDASLGEYHHLWALFRASGIRL